MMKFENPSTQSELHPSVERSRYKGEDSHERIGEVMKKVRDLNADGLGYSGAPFEKLGRILEFGILGNAGYTGNISKEQWVRELEQGKYNMDLYVNIVGRTRVAIPKGMTQIEKTSWANKPGAVTFLIDLTGFTEIEPADPENKGPHRLGIDPKRHGVLVPNDVSVRDNRGRAMPHLDAGFMIQPRCSPRRFLGIILPEQSKKNLTKVLEIMQEQRRMLPVYDTHGNLLWPRTMSHQEVKRFIAERDQNLHHDEVTFTTQ